MPTAAARRIVAIQDPNPLGDVTIAPSFMTGRSGADLAQDLADTLPDAGERTASEALGELRQTYPHMPLAVRVAALEAFRRR